MTKQNPYKQNKGFKRLFLAFVNSISGLKVAYLEESAFRQELLLCVILLPIPFLFPTSLIEKLIMIGSLFILLIVELLNTGIESAVDRISFLKHKLSKKAKDLGSAAVFLAFCYVLFSYITIIKNYI